LLSEFLREERTNIKSLKIVTAFNSSMNIVLQKERSSATAFCSAASMISVNLGHIGQRKK